MRVIASLLILSGLWSAVAPAVGQEAPTVSVPTGPVESADRPKINTGNKGGPPELLNSPGPGTGTMSGTTGAMSSTTATTGTTTGSMSDTTGTSTGTAAETGTTTTSTASTRGFLPATASSWPLLAVIGLLATMAALALRLVVTGRRG